MFKLSLCLFFSLSLYAQQCRLLSNNDHLKSFNGSHVIELFTSEGCSSCPPADQWLNRLKNRKDLWLHIVPIKFHVDYWNYIGHKDPYSNSENTLRQRAYARKWKSAHIYTPGFVLNSREWRSWFRKVPKEQRTLSNGQLIISRDSSNSFSLTFQTNDNFGKYSVLVLEQLDNISHKVRKGENAGRILNHHFSVISQRRYDFERVKQSYFKKIELVKTNKNSYFSFLVEKQGIPGVVAAIGGICL